MGMGVLRFGNAAGVWYNGCVYCVCRQGLSLLHIIYCGGLCKCGGKPTFVFMS